MATLNIFWILAILIISASCLSLPKEPSINSEDSAVADSPDDETGTNTSTEQSTEVSTDDPAETSTDATTETSTEATTGASTDATTEASTDATTETSTDATTETSTDATTETSTDDTTETSTDATTETSTDATTETSTDATTETSTDATTETSTDATTETSTDATTETSTDAPTEPSTERPSSTEPPTELTTPDLTGKSPDGNICLKVTLEMSLNVTYESDSGNKTVAIDVPTANAKTACKGENVSINGTPYFGPVVIYTWTTDDGKIRKAYDNMVAVNFEDDGDTSKLSNITATIATVGEKFPLATGETLKLTLPFTNVETTSGNSYTCIQPNFAPNSTDNGSSIVLNKVGFEFGEKLEESNFSADGQTCGAAEISIALLAVMLSVFSVSLTW